MSETSGATAMEYALIGAIISIVIVTCMATITPNLLALFAAVTASFQ